MKSIAFVFGTRPEIIKLSPLIRLSKKYGFKPILIHTNQHFDFLLDEVFFKQLDLPKPHFNLQVKGSALSQISIALHRMDMIFQKIKPSVVIVQGDTNSTLAGALTANKKGIPLAHVEAGLRSYDKSMPEEHNRIIVDHISDFLFTVTGEQTKILRSEQISKNKIYPVGNTIVDQLYMSHEKLSTKILKKYNLVTKKYHVATLHRPSNVDSKADLKEVLKLLEKTAEYSGKSIVWPIHPRTRKNIIKYRLQVSSNILLIDPLGYYDFITLLKNANLVFTDSGGLQEECCIMNIPCITLRLNTERPETIKVKSNFLVGRNFKLIVRAMKYFERNKTWSNPFGDGKTSHRILNTLKKSVGSRSRVS